MLVCILDLSPEGSFKCPDGRVSSPADTPSADAFQKMNMRTPLISHFELLKLKALAPAPHPQPRFLFPAPVTLQRAKLYTQKPGVGLPGWILISQISTETKKWVFLTIHISVKTAVFESRRSNLEGNLVVTLIANVWGIMDTLKLSNL